MINIKVSREELTPTRGSDEAGGYDLYLSHDHNLPPGRCAKIGTGVSFAIPKGYVGLLSPRSSTEGLRLENTVGVIDSDYRGEIFLKIRNTGKETRMLYALDRYFQIVIVPVLTEELNIVPELGNTERGDKGFGSTGR